MSPDWVAGISIGAINSALIAGNRLESRVEKLRLFWEQITIVPLPAGALGQIQGGLPMQVYSERGATSRVEWPIR